LERSWAVLGGLGPVLGGLVAVVGRCYSQARSVHRGGNRLARGAGGILLICLHRMHGVTVPMAMMLIVYYVPLPVLSQK